MAANMSNNKSLSGFARIGEGVFVIIFCVEILILGNNCAFAQAANSAKLEFYVTNPWIYLISSFIGGVEVEVIPLQVWNSNGDLVRAEINRNRNFLQNLDQEARVIALDEQDMIDSGLANNNLANNLANERNVRNVRILYSKFPIEINNISDPSIIPFVAQRVLVVLSEWDAANYPYYQRRLAEFQARLSSSILAGQILKGVSICAMSSTSGILLQAAGCKVERPEPEILEQWRRGKLSGLREYLNEKKSRDVIIIADDDMPRNLKKYLLARSDVFYWQRPQLDDKTDYPSFLHEQYISLWQRIIKKPLPRSQRSKK